MKNIPIEVRLNYKYDQKLYDDVCKEAAKRKCSVPELIRTGMRFYIDMFLEKQNLKKKK